MRTYHVEINQDLCKGTEGCGLCIAFCPHEVLRPSQTLTGRGVHPSEVADEDHCVGCRRCEIYCPDLAILVEEESDG